MARINWVNATKMTLSTEDLLVPALPARRGDRAQRQAGGPAAADAGCVTRLVRRPRAGGPLGLIRLSTATSYIPG